MPQRIEVELTSSRDDGTWTWRAAGAREPKGVLDASLLYEGAKVGDVVRADADFDIDGIVVTTVLPPKSKKQAKAQVLELLGTGRQDELVTSQLVGRRGGGGRDSRGRDDGGGRGGGGGGGRGPRDRADRSGRSSGRDSRGSENRNEERDDKPRAKRLRPNRHHRTAVLESLPPEHLPVAEQVLQGGIPAVRAAVAKQNEELVADGKPEISPDSLVALAEQLSPRLRGAEWADKADAALADVEELDLRDLRSVVASSDTDARSDETKAQAATLREALTRRVEVAHAEWMQEMATTLSDGRIVRALKLSSRPPKAAAPLPPEVAAGLRDQASAGMTADTGQERWATMLQAVSFSPVRQYVTPVSIPSEPSEQLLAEVKRFSSRVPQIAQLFGIEPQPESRNRAGRGRSGGGQGGRGKRSGNAQQKGAQGAAGKPNATPDARAVEPAVATSEPSPAMPEPTIPATPSGAEAQTPEAQTPEAQQTAEPTLAVASEPVSEAVEPVAVVNNVSPESAVTAAAVSEAAAEMPVATTEFAADPPSASDTGSGSEAVEEPAGSEPDPEA